VVVFFFPFFDLIPRTTSKPSPNLGFVQISPFDQSRTRPRSVPALGASRLLITIIRRDLEFHHYLDTGSLFSLHRRVGLR
jgi:hypothetical protein